jgi:hypothetical protein
VKLFHTTEKYIALALLVLLGLVAISGAVEISYEVVKSMVGSPGFLSEFPNSSIYSASF